MLQNVSHNLTAYTFIHFITSVFLVVWYAGLKYVIDIGQTSNFILMEDSK